LNQKKERGFTMLILTRKSGQSILIGDDIKIRIIEVKGNQVRIGVEAPRNISVHREEIYKIIQDKKNVG